MRRMSASSRKLKVSLTLSSDLLALVDKDAAKRGETRSGVIDQWLRRAAKESTTNAIHDATVKYYQSLTPEDAADNEAWARTSSEAAKRVNYDDVVKPASRKKRR